MAPENQIHDFNPHINSDGLFWTARIPDGNVTANRGVDHATMHVRNLHMFDDHDIANALQRGPSIGGTASFTVVWREAGLGRRRISDPAQDFVADLVDTNAQVAWNASNDAGFHFNSDSITTSKSVYAALGHERNGVFFRP